MAVLKKYVIFLIVLSLLVCGCTNSLSADLSYNSDVLKGSNTKTDKTLLKGVWISCFELDFSGLDKNGVQTKINGIMQNVFNLGYNAVFCHVRPFADAFYPSEYFPFSKYLTGKQGVKPGYDALKILISTAKKYNIEFHAWINPYRVSSSADTALLSDDNIAKKWLTDSSNRAVAINQKGSTGIYFNPSCLDVQNLILNGIKEILENYKVDGIHFDDYFYPTTDKQFDLADYEKYKANTLSPLSLANWRRTNVNILIEACYRLCNTYNVLFGISPAGDISFNNTDKNYTTLYADIPLWISTKGYVDYIIPQLYFGYEHPTKKSKYDYLLKTWVNLPRHSSVKLYIGLGAYKIGDTSVSDNKEWCSQKADLLQRQTVDALYYNADGIVVFSYNASVSGNKLNQLQIKNLFKVLNN